MNLITRKIFRCLQRAVGQPLTDAPSKPEDIDPNLPSLERKSTQGKPTFKQRMEPSHGIRKLNDH